MHAVRTWEAASGPGRVLAALATVALLAALTGAAPAAWAAERGEARAAPGAWASDWVVPGSVIVTTRDAGAAGRFEREGRAWLSSGGVAAGGVRELAPQVVEVEVPAGREAEAAAALLARPGVASVEPNYRFAFQRQPDDPEYEHQWAHAQTGAEAAWDRSTGDVSVRIAILDSGVDANHPDLRDNVVAQVDAVANPPRTRQAPTNNVDCPHTTLGYDHGTAVAGVAGAVGDNTTGVAGAAWRVGIVDVRVAGRANDTCGGPTTAAVLRGLKVVADDHAGVAAVTMSFGLPSPHCPPSLQSAVNTLRASGITVVAASGNAYGYDRMMPAGCEGVVAVGASRGDGLVASYSSRQRYVDLLAPGGEFGEGVLTTVRRRTSGGGIQYDYATRAGTSFAAPYVAGVVALVQELRERKQYGRLSPNDVESLLEVTARHPDGGGHHDPRFGWGILHAGDALRRADRQSPSLPSPPRTHPLTRFAWATTTEPVTQAIAVSRALFDRNEARHVLIARSDDYADALAGSGLGFGVGPILFTPPGRPLNERVLPEVVRVLPPGGRVYLLGGTVAVDPQVEEELRREGFDVKRLSGGAREDTAAVIAAEVVERVREIDFPVFPEVIVATRGNWPDAVAGGSLASAYGLPVLLTPVNSLHKATGEALEALKPSRVYVVGGTAAVSAATAAAIGNAAGVTPRRLSGPWREETAIAVGRELQRRLALANHTPPLAVAVNLDRRDAYAHTLAATAIAGQTLSVFVPVRWTSQSGARVPESVESYACGVLGPGDIDPGGGIDVVLAGGEDLLPAVIGRRLQDLYDRPSTAC